MTAITHDDPGAVAAGPLGLLLLDLIRKDPLRAAEQLQRQHGDVAKLDILFRRVYYFFTPEAARQILVEHLADFTREARLLKVFESFQGKNVVTTEGADWERQRRILAPGFSPRRVTSYMELMQAAIDSSCGDELPQAPGSSALIDVDFLTTRVTMDVILRTLFSHATTREEARRASIAIRALSRQSMREVYWLGVPPPWMPYPGRAAKRKHLETLNTLISTQIEARARSGEERKDVLDMMLAARDEAPASGNASLTAEEVHANCLSLFSAGFDTSSSALTWWIGLMATHADIAEAVRREIALADPASLDAIARLPYLNATIKEAMRICSPATALFTRVALRDVVIGETPVPKGTLVAIPIWNLHRDPRSFAEPERFRPQRFLPDAPPIPRSAYMPFGAGPHFCLGQHFATIEMALIAAHIVRNYDLALEPGAQLPEPFVDVALKPKTTLRVRFTRRAATASDPT